MPVLHAGVQPLIEPAKISLIAAKSALEPFEGRQTATALLKKLEGLLSTFE